MKSKLKYNFPMVYACLGLLFMVMACQKDDIAVNEDLTQEGRFKYISLAQFNAKVGHDKDYNKLSALFDINQTKPSQFNRLEQSDNPWIMTDEIIAIEKDDVTFYTFRIGTTSETDNFFNLVVAVSMGEILSMRVLEYIPSEGWLQDKSQPFVGEVSIEDNNIFSEVELSDALFGRFGSNLCVSGATGEWECNYHNNHSPADAANDANLDCTSWEFIITVEWSPCPEEIDAGDSSTGGLPIDGGSTGSSNGGTTNGNNSSGNNNDNNNGGNDSDIALTDGNGDSITDQTTILKPRDNEEEEYDCTQEADADIIAELDAILGEGNHEPAGCDVDMTNAIIINSEEELEEFMLQLSSSRTNGESETYVDIGNQNMVTTKFVFWDFLTKYNIYVHQQLGDDYVTFSDYNVENITSTETGITFAGEWQQTYWDHSMDSYQMTANVFGTVTIFIFYKGIGELISADYHFRVVTNATNGGKISQQWVD